MNAARVLIPITLALHLCACAHGNLSETQGGSATPPAVISTPRPLDAAYVILPGNYIIDVAAGSEVTLNPDIGEFVIFSSPDTAQKALRAELATGRLAPGDWRVYSLAGDFASLARPCGSGRHCLAVPAIVADWVEG